MKYRLMTPLYEKTPGDAAPIYLDAIKRIDRIPDDLVSAGTTYEAMPLAELAHSDVDKYLAAFADVSNQIKMATPREECRWDPRMNVSEISQTRGLFEPLLVQLRVQIAREQYDQAAATCRDIFALAHSLRGSLLQALEGEGYAKAAIEQIEELEKQPGSPNFYGALADLPRPFFDFPELLQNEQSVVLSMIPEFKQAADHPLKPDQWNDVLPHFMQLKLLFAPFPQVASAVITAYGGPSKLATLFPEARPYVIAHKLLSADEADKGPSNHVIGVYLFAKYQEFFDQAYIAARLPYPQAFEALGQAQNRLGPHLPGETFPRGNPFMLTDSLISPLFALGSLDRDIALHQCVEAIRAYAASHDGKPPQRLEDMTDPPAPPNPLTGQPFIYTADGQVVEFDIRPPAALEKGNRRLVRVTVAR
ncbi:MAG: hypothetical protein ABSH22_07730 [Tepidisphaeraceae bacterium]